MERGTVSMRVALVLRSAEVQPLFQDLCKLVRSFDETTTLANSFLPHVLDADKASAPAMLPPLRVKYTKSKVRMQTQTLRRVQVHQCTSSRCAQFNPLPVHPGYLSNTLKTV